MANWDANETLSRESAIPRIKEIAREEGITGAFKVYYNGNLVSAPEDLPADVDMSLVRVSAVLDNATM